MKTSIETLRARWIAKRNEYITGKRIPGRYFAGPDDYARRELRAYRLVLGWNRDRSLPGRWVWARRDTRWDVYPSQPRAELLREVPDGPGFIQMFHLEGGKARVSYFVVREAS